MTVPDEKGKAGPTERVILCSCGLGDRNSVSRDKRELSVQLS